MNTKKQSVCKSVTQCVTMDPATMTNMQAAAQLAQQHMLQAFWNEKLVQGMSPIKFSRQICFTPWS